MIPTRLLTDWRSRAPWPDEDQVELDLVLTRVLVVLYADPRVRDLVAFRGGTAIHRIALPEPLRYSEDLDLVQREAGPVKPLLATIQPLLDPWLGRPSIEQRRDAVRLLYRYDAEASGARRRVKVEINTREHGALDGWREHRMACDTRWFQGSADVVTFTNDELIATKLRALYQRRKGRDLFDLAAVLEAPVVDPRRVVDLFRAYLERQGLVVRRRTFAANLALKVADPLFVGDVGPLLRPGLPFDPRAAALRVEGDLLVHLS